MNVRLHRQKRLQFLSELLTSSTHVFWQAVPNSWCSNTETACSRLFPFMHGSTSSL